MKIAVTSDLHGTLPFIDKCELLLICGDIVPLSIQRRHIESYDWFQKEFSEWINNIKCNEVIMVGGNHDYFLETLYQDEPSKKDLFEGYCNKKITILDNESMKYTDSDNRTHIIWGTPYCSKFGKWAYMHDKETLEQAYSTMPNKCDIVLAHHAPKLVGLGKIYERNGYDAGNEVLAKEVLNKQPKYLFCGHIHSGEHTMQFYNGTYMVNVSLNNESYEPVNKIFYFEV